MSKIIDITDKLNFEEKPKLIIKGVEITVNDSAKGILEIFPLLKNDVTPGEIKKICETLFSPEDIEKLSKLKLNFVDFTTVIYSAIGLVTGSDEDDEGEEKTPAMTLSTTSDS